MSSHDDNHPQNRSPRDHLRSAALQLDATQDGSLGPAVARTKGLAGRWTLLDAFEADGKQYVLAASDVRGKPATQRPLTSREKQVLALADAGLTNKEIAFELGVTATTIRVLIARAANRLGVVGRAAVIAAFRAIRADERAPELQIALA